MGAGIDYTMVERVLLAFGLSLFFGFAFEEFYADVLPRRPGGVRTFPLLALGGAGLYLLDPGHGAAFIAGLLVLGLWIYTYIRVGLEREGPPPDGPLIVPICNLLAYLLGALALSQPVWLSIGIAVAAVLLLGSRTRLHDWAQRLPAGEIVTAGQFLVLVGVVLPLLPGLPAIPYTTITPFGVWLAVVAVSSISYASYLIQRLTPLRRGTLWSAILGGLYSSTATTVVFARRARDEGMTPSLEAGIVAATAIMYLRILFVVTLFNVTLARQLAPTLLVLAALSALLAVGRSRRRDGAPEGAAPLGNPLQLSTALVFAALFVAVAMLGTFAERFFGHTGIFALAGIVGVTDIDPFVLSLAQGGAATVGIPASTIAVLIAISSNNVLKAVYTLAFARTRDAWVPAAMLIALALAGLAGAWLYGSRIL